MFARSVLPKARTLAAGLAIRSSNSVPSSTSSFMASRTVSSSATQLNAQAQQQQQQNDWFASKPAGQGSSGSAGGNASGQQQIVQNFGSGSISEHVAQAALVDYINLVAAKSKDISANDLSVDLRKVFVDYSKHVATVTDKVTLETLINPNPISAPQYATIKWVAFQRHIKQTGLMYQHPPALGVFSDFQFKRGAEMVTNVLNFIEQIQTTGKIPLIPDDDNLNQRVKEFENLFGGNVERKPIGDYVTSGKPRFGKDAPKDASQRNDHIVILLDNHFFKVPVYKVDGSRLSVDELIETFLTCSRKTFNAPKIPLSENVCFYNGLSRPIWTPVQEKLTKDHPEFFRDLDTALFVMSFDNHTYKDPRRMQVRQFAQSKLPINRYFDKTLSFVIANNGTAGALIKTAGADAEITDALFNYMTKHEPPYYGDVKSDSDVPLPETPEITVRVKKGTALTEDAAEFIKNDMKSIWKRTSFSSTSLPYLGKKYIREVVGLERVDAFVNIAIALAYSRVFGKVPTLYHRNATSERPMNKYPEIVPYNEYLSDLVKSFDDATVSNNEKLALFALSAEFLNNQFSSNNQEIVNKLRAFYSTKNAYEMSKNIVSGDGLDAGPLSASLISANVDTDFTLFTENFGGKYNNGGMATTPDMKYRFESGINPTTAGGIGVGYAVDEFGIRFMVNVRRTRGGQGKIDANYFKVDLEKAVRDLTRIFPMRSDIWGSKFLFEQQEEHSQRRAYERMKVLSEKYIHKYGEDIKKKFESRLEEDVNKF